MRAIYHPFEKIEGTLLVTDEQAKHLQVVRIRTGEEVLVLNGKGQRASAKVGLITKNSVELIISSVESALPYHSFQLAIGVPKKDAFEDILKMAVELGVRSIQPLTTEFSQYEYVPGERIHRILESALIQSNNAFLPMIHPQKKLTDFLADHQAPLYFFNSRPSETRLGRPPEGEKTILIGPEGGFSERETALILSQKDLFSVHLPTPIQRAPTAVASSLGYLLAVALS